MRVLQVTPGYPPTTGGVERHVEALSAALVARGHSVTVLSLDAGTTTSGRTGQVEVLRVPGRTIGPFLVARRLRRTVRALAAEHDVVHVHNYHSPLPLAVLRSRSGRPVVVTTHFHGGGHDRIARLAHLGYAPLMRSALRRAAAVVCVSRAEADHLVATFPEQRGRVRVVRNGVRPLDPSLALAAHWREPLVVCVSRLEEYKRVDALIRAMAMINGPWRCVVVGVGPQRTDLEALAIDLGIADRVTFAGTVSDAELDALLLKARVCVQPSSREAFGMALLDGVGAGCRVVASDIPAHVEIGMLTAGAVQLWHAEGGPVALAGAVVRALSDVAPAVAPQLPTWADAALALESVYQRALRTSARRTAEPTTEPIIGLATEQAAVQTGEPTTEQTGEPVTEPAPDIVLGMRIVDGVIAPPRAPQGRGEVGRGPQE